MEEIGAPVERGLEQALLPVIVHRDPETLVPVYLAHSFLDKSARAVGLADFGFVVGRNARVGDLGAFGQSIRRSLTLQDALGKIETKFSLYSSAEKIWWSRTRPGQTVSFYHTYRQEPGAGSRYAQQCALLLMRDVVRLAAGPAWQPAEVFATPLLDVSAVKRTFETENVRQALCSGFAFPAEFLSQPLARFQRDGIDGDAATDTRLRPPLLPMILLVRSSKSSQP
jgi:hypothetical protein